MLINFAAAYSPSPDCDLWDAKKYRGRIDVCEEKQEFLLPGIEGTQACIKITARIRPLHCARTGLIVLIEEDDEVLRHMLIAAADENCFEHFYSWHWQGSLRGKFAKTKWRFMAFRE